MNVLSGAFLTGDDIGTIFTNLKQLLRNLLPINCVAKHMSAIGAMWPRTKSNHVLVTSAVFKTQKRHFAKGKLYIAG